MDTEVKNIVREIQEQYIGEKRIDKRKEFEDTASKILAKNLGRLTLNDIERVIELLDSDYYRGEIINRRFGLALWGRNRKLILRNDAPKLNTLIAEVYGKEKLDEIEIFKHGLKGVGSCFISCLLYLKNGEKYNVFIGATAEGIKAVFPEEGEIPTTLSFEDRYNRFNDLARRLKEECGLKPQELDVVLTVVPSRITRIETAVKKPEEPIEQIIDVKELAHSDVQGILVELGNLLGYETYVADPSKVYKGKPLREWATLKTVPSFTYPRLLKFIGGIDVIWFSDKGSELPVACFEVEHTTDVTKGLLRLFQIKSISTKLFIIAPSDLEPKFQKEVTKDPFYKIRDRFIFKPYEQLVGFSNVVKRYRRLRRDFFAY